MLVAVRGFELGKDRRWQSLAMAIESDSVAVSRPEQLGVARLGGQIGGHR